MCSSSRRLPTTETQIRPRPYFDMKLMAAGVASWAAIVRSPSFSRSSSSMTTSILPARVSAMASSIVASGIEVSSTNRRALSAFGLLLVSRTFQYVRDITRNRVGFEVEHRARVLAAERRADERFRDERHGKFAFGDRCDGEANAVERYAALFGDQRLVRRRRHAPDAIAETFAAFAQYDGRSVDVPVH